MVVVVVGRSDANSKTPVRTQTRVDTAGLESLVLCLVYLIQAVATGLLLLMFYIFYIKYNQTQLLELTQSPSVAGLVGVVSSFFAEAFNNYASSSLSVDLFALMVSCVLLIFEDSRSKLSIILWVPLFCVLPGIVMPLYMVNRERIRHSQKQQHQQHQQQAPSQIAKKNQ